MDKFYQDGTLKLPSVPKSIQKLQVTITLEPEMFLHSVITLTVMEVYSKYTVHL